MKTFFGYTRVSTNKQGEQGVSLQEQHDAIARYAQRNGLTITQWFEERETAAKYGRRIFGQMLKLLRHGKADGVVIHKIDRSARNLKDWADLGQLIDGGIEVHFANESLDLHSRGGRLSADIQAVVAADYVRNLREETRKGFYGRLKQGFYPLPAPLGYLNRGKGKLKELDPVKAPLVRQGFELYATGQYSLQTLLDELYRRGLRNRRGGRLSETGLCTVLHNPFYIGLIRLRRTGEMFPGSHEPLIVKSLFDRVQQILAGRTPFRTVVHGFVFRRLLTCAGCKYSLIGERQKGHAYYRCHTKECPTTCVREESIDGTVRAALTPLEFDAHERAHLHDLLTGLRKDWALERDAETNALTLRLHQVTDRLTRLTDAYLDGAIERSLFDERKAALLLERKDVEERLADLRTSQASVPDKVADFLELAGGASRAYELAEGEEKRDLLASLTSNRTVSGKSVVVELAEPFRLVAERHQNANGAPYRGKA